MRLINLQTTMLIIMVFSSVAFADFKYYGPTKGSMSDQEQFFRLIIPSDNFIEEVPLSLALQALVGSQVQVDIGTDIDSKQLVSFRGGRSRGEILDEILGQSGVVYRYRDGRFVVRSSREAALAARLGETTDDAFLSQNFIWRAPAGHLLEDVLTHWTERAGYVLQYKIGPVQLGASAEFEGRFEDAVKEAVQSLGADFPLVSVKIRGRVLIIEAI